jgi:cbb3-type cytochrome oxidase subunit 3
MQQEIYVILVLLFSLIFVAIWGWMQLSTQGQEIMDRIGCYMLDRWPCPRCLV